MSRIIIEGPDGTGKTTLGMRLADSLRLGFYRKRCMHGIAEETERALNLTDCVLDRSWMTDLVYSRVYNRTPGCSRQAIYKFGLLSARWTCLNIHLVPMRPAEGSELEKLANEYQKGHWSEPEAPRTLEMWQRPSDQSVESIIGRYRSYASIIDCCPSPGIGNAGPCEVLFLLNPGPVIFDLCYACGLKPHQVHFAPEDSDPHYLAEWFKPKMVLSRSGIKMAIESRTFEMAQMWLANQLQEAKVDTQVLDPGWAVLDEGPKA